MSNIPIERNNFDPISDTLELLTLEELERTVYKAPDNTVEAFEEQQRCLDVVRTAYEARESKDREVFDKCKKFIREWLIACNML